MSSHPYQDPTLPVEQRVADLLSRMTLEEKIAQIYQIWVIPAVPESPQMVKDYIRKYGVGSRILAGSHLAGSAQERTAGVEEINAYQRVAVEESRLGIPILHGRDVIHGFRTMFPIPLGMAASWDPALVEEAFTIAAREAASCGVKWAFAPMLDIARDPRWGRISEGSGEDPYLASQMAVAAVKGFQGEDLSDPAARSGLRQALRRLWRRRGRARLQHRARSATPPCATSTCPPSRPPSRPAWARSCPPSTISTASLPLAAITCSPNC